METKSNNRSLISLNSDYIGVIGSTLCLIHCLATPFLLAAYASLLSTYSDISPTWWKMIDLAFLVITYIAVKYSSKSTSISWMAIALYSFWIIFSILALNNFFQLLSIPHALIYIPAICLSLLHLYNKRYCKCNANDCCVL